MPSDTIGGNPTYFQLSDSVFLLTVVLPKPTLAVAMATSYVTARTEVGESHIDEVDFKIDVTFDPGMFESFGEDIEDLAYLFTD